MSGKRFLVGIFDHEDKVKGAVTSLRDGGANIHEVFSPYAIHGIDDLLGYKMSRLPRASFLFGMTGTILAFSTLWLMMGYDWPMIIGGKNFASVPPFIPVTFEFTVLLAAFGMVFTFFIASDLKPWARPKIFDIRITLDKFAVVIDLDKNKLSKTDLEAMLNSSGASEVNEKNYNS
jgi:hypothetical protein